MARILVQPDGWRTVPVIAGPMVPSIRSVHPRWRLRWGSAAAGTPVRRGAWGLVIMGRCGAAVPRHLGRLRDWWRDAGGAG